MSRKWRGTALFAVIMAGVSATVAGRMLLGGDSAGAPAAAATAGTDSGSGSTTGAPATSAGATPAPSASTGAGSAANSSGAASSSGSSTSGSGSGSGSTTVTGNAEQTRFGTVQVSVTFAGSKITSVQTLQAPEESGRDAMLTRYATPQLAKEVIASQSAKVDTVSGATYTSEGYLASVQSAIDAHG